MTSEMTSEPPAVSAAESHGLRPRLSLVVPAYNEEAIVGPTLRRLHAAFQAAGIPLELVVVDNGSSDRTGAIAREFAEQSGGSVRVVRVDVNRGYGYGLLQGFPAATAPWIGFIPADGQVDAEDVVRLFEAVEGADGWVLGKVRRRFRLDGFKRKFVSTLYNVLVLAMWPRLGSLDVNGAPKMMRREVLDALDIRSQQWFIDPELMVKAHYLGVRVFELNVFSRMRGNGLSHVRPSTCWEFLRNLFGFRFSGTLREWRRTTRLPERPARSARPAPLETAAR